MGTKGGRMEGRTEDGGGERTNRRGGEGTLYPNPPPLPIPTSIAPIRSVLICGVEDGANWGEMIGGGGGGGGK